MSFPSPSTQVATTHLDSGSDDPSQARGDLLEAVTLLNEIVAGQNSADGVAVLDSSGSIPYNRLPQSIAWQGVGNQIISPVSGIVEIQDIVRLTPLLKAQLQSISTATLTAGCIAYCSDVSTGTAGVVVWTGSVWNTIGFTGEL